MECGLGRAQRWRSPVAWESWGKPVFRLTVLSVGRKSGLGAGEFERDGASTEAEARPGRRGMEAGKFGHDHGPATKCDWRCSGINDNE